MKANTSLIETDLLMTLVRCNERQAMDIKKLEGQMAKVRSLIETTADDCIVNSRIFRYASIDVAKLCEAVGLDFEEQERYVEKAKLQKKEDSELVD